MKSFTAIPLKHPKPDKERFINALLGKQTISRPPLIEYNIDVIHQRAIITQLCNRSWVGSAPGDRASQCAYWDNFTEVWYRLGYDFVRLEIALPFPLHSVVGEDLTMVNQVRGWADEHKGAIESWEDFEKYPWPAIAAMDFFPLEYISTHLPEGLGLITNHGGGPFEIVTRLMSYEKFCYALYDDPPLVKAIVEKVGNLFVAYYQQLAELPNLIALFQGDDMGFRSGTLARPDTLRELFLPWHKSFADISRRRGIPYFLHSCGELSALYEDLINDVGISGKHSFEDAILPAPEFQKLYGDRIATLGGVDVDILAGSTSEQVRARTRELMTICGARGRFAVGSGNSIPSYIPLENYLTMVDTALTF
jgi:uroporphyrinogen decarboxylase